MTEMTFVALGMFRDAAAVTGARRDLNRLWRTSFIAAFATNMMLVLNRCTESGSETHRVQFFVNERPTELCPLSGCSWEQFEELVKDFDDNLEFCSLEYPEPELELPGGGGGGNAAPAPPRGAGHLALLAAAMWRLTTVFT